MSREKAAFRQFSSVAAKQGLTIRTAWDIKKESALYSRQGCLGELAEKVDITPANLSILKTGKAKAIRFSTLEAICKVLDCQPGDILEFQEGEE